MGLLIRDHPHAIEYHRSCGDGRREHVHTELVDDQGFVLVHDPEKRQDWLARYTRTCAEEYLARSYARAGEWFVHVYRITAEERQHIISIRLHWSAEATSGMSTSGQVGVPEGPGKPGTKPRRAVREKHQ